MNDTFQGEKILVVGMARSGIAVAELLASFGAQPVLSDMRTDIEGLDVLEGLGCIPRLGVPSEDLVEGCAAVIVSPAVPLDAPVIRKAEALGVPVWAELEFAARYVKGTQIAITGTNGKTTTSSLVGAILTNAGKITYVAGNIGLPLSAVAPKTTEEDYTVIEVSSFQLEHIDQFHPRGAALLNLTPDHLNRHGTMQAYGMLKEGMLRNQNKVDFFVYNADDAFCVEVASRAQARAVPFSRTQVLANGAWMQDGQLMLEGRALCKAEEMNLPGPHNLENALAAAAIASQLGVHPAVIRHTLRSFAGVEHRMETVRTLGGVRWINDSKGPNPESSMRGVEGMNVPTVLIAGGDEKGNDFSVFAEAISGNESIRHVILIGKTAGRIRDALAAAGYTDVTMAGTDFAKAIHMAREMSEEGGAVLMSPACASFDMFKDFEARGNQFKEIVNALV